MTLTSRRKRPLDRSIPHLRDTRLVVVATEGDTEAQYFQMFQRQSSRVQVIALPTEDGRSAPKHVLNRLRGYRREYDLAPEDILGLVIDEDRWPKEQLADVAAKCLQQGIELAVSCPCFEIWLYLHLADPPRRAGVMDCKAVKSELRKLLGAYNSSNLRVEDFAPFVDDAIQRARSLDTNEDMRWPGRPGTRVYRVVEHITALL